MQDELHTLYTSGTVFHSYLGEKLPSWKAAANLVRTIAENYRLPYYSISPTYSVCKNHGYLAGEQFTCPECGEKTEVYSRITGYYRPVQNWNDGKTQEYKDRTTYSHAKLGNKQPLYGEAFCETTEGPSDPSAVEKIILFTTKSCPKCTTAKFFLNQAKVSYETVLAEESADLCREMGIKEAPTLVIVRAGGIEKIANPSNIKAYCDKAN